MSELNLESYPPLFRQPNKPIQQNAIESAELDDSIKGVLVESDGIVPVIDLQCLEPEKLEEACKHWGFFRLINHGVPITLLSQLQDQAKKIYSLSFESKQTLITKPLSYFWGTPVLTASGSALSRGPQNINWVEGLNVPLSQLSHQLQADHHEEPMLDSFRHLLEEYGRHLGRIARSIFTAMAKNLGLDPNKSGSHLSESTGYVRVYRYPHCGNSNATTWGIDVHTDSSVLSILSQDLVGGFEVFKDNKWLNIKPIPNTLILVLGDLMQAISNDEYMAAKHRVKVNKHVERISICYFVFPDEDCVIQSPKYKPFTNGDFRAQVQEDIKTVGFKVGLEKFKVSAETC